MAEKKAKKAAPKKKTTDKRKKTPLYGMTEKQLKELDRKINYD